MSVRYVAPYFPLPLDAPHHQELAAFDWVAAIQMLDESVRLSCGQRVEVLTDASADLPLRCLKYATTTRRLMLWTLEACACYLESADFDRDTVMLDCDQLVYKDLARHFRPGVDLGILVRRTPKDGPGLPILNGVQFWSLRGRGRLGPFYREALRIAEGLPEADIVWGADTVALERLLAPLDRGLRHRAGLAVHLQEANEVIEALNASQVRHLAAGRMRRPYRDVLDFRNTRKPHMRAAFEQTIAHPVRSQP
jgi:hypothetical protein